MRFKQALKTHQETICRLGQDEAYTLEEQSSAPVVMKGALSTPIDQAIITFLSRINVGPEFVCMVCHRLMYKVTVVPYNKSKYTKANSEVLEQVFCDAFNYINYDGKQWVCKTCDRALSRGNMPLQAKANNLQLDAIPAELSTIYQNAS